VQPEIQLGPLELKTFGICLAVAFLGAGALVGRRLLELGRPGDWAYEIAISAMVGGLLGSRIDYLIQNPDALDDGLLSGLFSGAGFVWFGGLLGGAAGVLLWARLRGYLGVQLLDVCAPGLALGYALGRIGCQLSGDGDYGVASELPWAMAYPEGTLPTDDEVHPTPIYETMAMGLVALLLWRLRDRVRPGILFALYLVLSGLERLLVELVRRNDEVVAGLTLPQLVSVGMIAAGAVWLARRGRQEPLTA